MKDGMIAAHHVKQTRARTGMVAQVAFRTGCPSGAKAAYSPKPGGAARSGWPAWKARASATVLTNSARGIRSTSDRRTDPNGYTAAS